MPYILGASFSNVQHSFNSPTYFIAFAIESTRKSELQGIRTKEEIQKDPEFSKNLFDLFMVEYEINRFRNLTVRSELIKLAKKNRKEFENDLGFMLAGFLKAIESIRSSRLNIASEGFEKCFLHIPLDPEGKELVVEDLDYFNHPLSKYNIKFQKKGEFDLILELARLGAWFEYLDMMRRKRPFINKQISENKHFQFLQFFRLIWNSPPIESYPDGFVGYPRMILKTLNTTEDLIIRPGQDLDFFPIARACAGSENDLEVPKCKNSSVKEPFGTLLLNEKFEKCTSCSQNSIGSLCLFHRARCDGKEMQCGDKAFIGNVCHGEFCIYVTLYGNKIKIGRGMKSRIVGRLIEQGAFDGLVFYPIPWLPFADYLEEKLAKLLKSKAPDLGIATVDRVSEKVTSKERFENIISLSTNATAQARRDKIYDRIIEVLSSLNNAEATYLMALERRKVHFGKNWIGYRENRLSSSDFVHDIRFRRICGKITGVVGPFLIVDNKAYNTSKMEGYVIGVPNK
jgi:hypothetical protein